jgi:predicted nuclease with TOPRIM domain
MASIQERLDGLRQELEQTRDELRVRMHLANAELKDEWRELEQKWDHFEGRLKKVGSAAGESFDDMGDALELVGDELKRSYQRIRKSL